MDYLIRHSDKIYHFFFKKNEGLCVRTKKHSLWQNCKPVFSDTTEIFSVFCDSSDNLHAICVSPENNLIYLHFKDNTWHKCTLTHINHEMRISDIIFFENPIGLNILYTAQYLGETLLIHCVLGNNAMPNTVDKLSSPYFFVFNNNIYYTDSHSVLGYRSVSDGRPDRFNRLTDNAEMPYLAACFGKSMLVYKKDGSLYFQNRPIHKDIYASRPILLEDDDKLFLEWQSGDFVRYMSSSDGGAHWSGVMQFVNPGKKPQLYSALTNAEHEFYYGSHSDSDLHIYIKSNWFAHEKKERFFVPPKIPDSAEVTKLNIMLELQKQEIVSLKKEISRLGEYINSMNTDAHNEDEDNEDKVDT